MYDIFGDLVTARKMPRVGEVREILLQKQGYSTPDPRSRWSTKSET